MVLRKLFGGKSKSSDETLELDPLADLVLEKLRVGFLVDYDMQTWTVGARSRYDFGGYEVDEWELVAGREKRYLELEHEEDSWSLSKKIPIGAIDGDVRREILEHEDPPARVTYDGTEYYLDDALAGHLYEGVGDKNEKDGDRKDGSPLIRWEYLDEDEKNFLSIEQWGENQFAAAVGFEVEDYQFTNILPGTA